MEGHHESKLSSRQGDVAMGAAHGRTIVTRQGLDLNLNLNLKLKLGLTWTRRSLAWLGRGFNKWSDLVQVGLQGMTWLSFVTETCPIFSFRMYITQLFIECHKTINTSIDGR